MRILIATGGTGGHIFPAIQTALVLRQEGHEILFAGALDWALDQLRQKGFSVKNIRGQGLTRRSPLAMISFIGTMLAAFVRSLNTVRTFGPDRVVGFGAYSSFPVVCAARMFGCPAVIHEQNAVPGKANRWLAPLARRVAVTFEETARFFPKGKTVWTGCPCHDRPPQKNKEELLRQFHFHKNRRTLLVLGGSQGSRFLNETFLETLSLLTNELPLQVIHQTGKEDLPVTRERYQTQNIPYCVQDFFEEMGDVYALADLVVARSGAATVNEIMAFGLPAVFVPYPFAESHQKANAEVLVREQAAWLIEQKDLSPQVLKNTILKIFQASSAAAPLKDKLQKFTRLNAAQHLAEVILS